MMDSILDIPLDALETREEFQVRCQMEEDAIDRYENLYRRCGDDSALPPITVTKSPAEETWIVLDGHHRIEAAKRAGLEKIHARDADFANVANLDGHCIAAAICGNAQHGLPLSRSDRRRAAELLEAFYPHLSLRALEEMTNGAISKSTFANIRKENNSPEVSNLDTQDTPAEIKCDTCGMRACESSLTAPESDWVKVCGKMFCCPKCREAFESQASEKALEKAGDEYLAAFGEAEDSEPRTERSEVQEEQEKLQPCPFCGSEVKFFPSEPKKFAMFSCDDCGAVVYFLSSVSERKIRDKWNTRR